MTMNRFDVGKLPLFAGALLLAAAAGGCTVTTSSDTVVPVGRLVLDWTIDEAKDPNLCLVSGAAAFDISISTTSGAFINEFQAPCQSFSTTISTLPPGSFVANAQLMAADGDTPRTTTIAINPFTITSSDLVIPVDFPADSFL